MKTEDQFRYVYNAYHGNADRNIVPKVKLLVNGKGIFEYLYHKVPASIVINRNIRLHDNEEVDDSG